MTKFTRGLIYFVLICLPIFGIMWLVWKGVFNSDDVTIFGYFIGFGALALSGWIMKVRIKKRMERGLRRSVKDYELTSITTWMSIPAEAQKAAKDADEYNFKMDADEYELKTDSR